MSANTYEPLENMISAGINSDFPEAPPTEAEFNDKADTLRKALQNVYPVTDEEFEGIKRRLRERIAVQMDIGVYIQDRNNGHQSWLPAKKSQRRVKGHGCSAERKKLMILSFMCGTV